MDTLRADRLGCYGSAAARTPHIDRLAREGTLFEHAASPMPLTRPSHFSLLTSRYPRDHGVVNNAIPLGGEQETLAETLEATGYRTAAFVAVSLLGEDSGAAQGFATFDAPGERQRPASAVVPRALAWLEGPAPPRPFFVWLHLFDPHMPYAPPPAYDPGGPPEVVASLPEASWPRLIELAEARDGDLPRAYFERAVALYDGEVEFVDHWIGELRAGLEDQGLLERTVLALTADHGECFGHGIFFEHASCLYDEGVAVPLLVRYPRAVPAGARRGEQVEVLDVAPTLLRLAGLPVPAGHRGRPLFPVAPPVERFAFLQHPLDRDLAVERRGDRRDRLRSVAGQPLRPPVVREERSGVRSPRWKYLRTGDAEELFDLLADPGEEDNAAGRRTEVAQALRDALDGWLDDHPLRIADPGQINRELLETLEALGYLQ